MKENDKPTETGHSSNSPARAESGSERFNELLLDAIPHPAMLVRRDQTILAANRMARELGAKVGGLCWRDFGHGECIPEEDKCFISEHGGSIPPAGTKCTFCLANEAFAAGKPTNNPRVRAFGQIWDTYWIPVDGDVYLHYAINVTEREQAEEQLQSAFTEAKQKQAETLALVEASRAVLRYREFKDAARAIFAACKNLVGATAGYVALLNKDENANEIILLDPGEYPCTVDPSLPMPMRGMREKAFRLGAAVYENSFAQSEWARYMPAGHVNLNNVLFAPLVVDGKTIGLLGLGNKPGGFSENDARLASAFGELVAIALNNSRTLETLEGSEERYRLVMQTANDAVISADRHGNIVLWNLGAQTVFGYSADEVIGKPITILMPERYREAHEKGISRLVISGEPKIIGKTVELVGLRKNGEEFSLELSLGMLREDKEILFTAMIRDITERKRAEEELSKHREHLEQLVDERTAALKESALYLKTLNRLLGLFMQTMSRKEYLDAAVDLLHNWSGCRYVGIRALDEEGNIPYESSVGFSKEFLESESELNIKKHQCVCTRVIDAKPESQDIPFITTAGSFLCSNTLKFSEGLTEEERARFRGVCIGAGFSTVAVVSLRYREKILGAIHFADEREGRLSPKATKLIESMAPVIGEAIWRFNVEQDIKRLQQQNEMILNSAGEGIYGLDMEGKTTFVNPAAAKLVGYESAELIGKSQHAMIHHTRPDGTPYPREKCPIYAAFSDGSLHHVDDEVFWRKEGTSFPVEYTSTPTRNERGELTGAVVVFKDITERKRTEAELKQSLEKLQKTLEGSVSTLALVAEMRDPYTAGHQRRVSQLCVAIAGEMGLPKEQTEGLRIASYIHDIGKIAVPAEILSKPSKLSEHEFGIIKAHTELAYDMLKDLEFPWPVAQIILQHHERLDGSGYPHGLSAESILLEAKILAVADVIEAMASHRPYRPAIGIDRALLEILQKKGTLYDPKVVDVCLKLFTEKGFKLQ